MRLRTIAVGLAITGCSLQAIASPQESSSQTRTPGKGDAVVAKGCLAGPSLQSTETVTTDETGRVATPLTYQLKGDKKLLRQLREAHDGRLVEVTGILKSALPQDSALRGRTIGKTRVTFGIGTPSAQAGGPDVAAALPVLEVKSFEGLGTRCK